MELSILGYLCSTQSLKHVLLAFYRKSLVTPALLIHVHIERTVDASIC